MVYLVKKRQSIYINKNVKKKEKEMQPSSDLQDFPGPASGLSRPAKLFFEIQRLSRISRSCANPGLEFLVTFTSTTNIAKNIKDD